MSVPRDATPFRRDENGFAGYMFMYKENTEENAEKVRNAAKELKAIWKTCRAWPVRDCADECFIYPTVLVPIH